MMKRVIGYILFACGAAILLWLGYWQIERLQWKQDIIQKLNKEYQKDASSYALKPEDFIPAEDGEFKVVRGKINGRFLSGKTMFWPKINKAQYGFQLIDPLLLDNGKVLMVSRGWVARKTGTDLPKTLYMPLTDTEVKVIGLVRSIETNYFTLENQPKINHWYRFRPQQIANHIDVNEVLPTVLFAERIEKTRYKALGDISGSRVYPRNKHNQYAFFWFTLAGLWIVVLAPVVFRKKY